jgi:hypothetical protein
MLPPGGLSLGGPTAKTDRIIWAPSIPPIDWAELHQTISVRGILEQAFQLRNGTDCTFAFGTDVQPFSGSQCIVFVVEYADGIRYGFRLPYHSRKYKHCDLLWSDELKH